MESNICLNCQNSACCKEFSVEVGLDEYNELDESIKIHFIRFIDLEINKYPQIKGTQIEKMLDLEFARTGRYAFLNSSDDGYCVFLNRENMLCSIYENRPSVCAKFTTDRCDTIRVLEL